MPSISGKITGPAVYLLWLLNEVIKLKWLYFGLWQLWELIKSGMSSQKFSNRNNHINSQEWYQILAT